MIRYTRLITRLMKLGEIENEHMHFSESIGRTEAHLPFPPPHDTHHFQYIFIETVKLTPVRFVEEGGTRMGHTVMCDWKATYLSVRPYSISYSALPAAFFSFFLGGACRSFFCFFRFWGRGSSGLILCYSREQLCFPPILLFSLLHTLSSSITQ